MSIIHLIDFVVVVETGNTIFIANEIKQPKLN